MYSKMIDRNIIFVCDFETQTERWYKKYGKVEPYLIHIGNLTKTYSKYFVKLDNFMKECERLTKENKNKCIFFFHNLIWDIEFVIYWCLENGYEYNNKCSKGYNSFKQIKTDLNNIYSFNLSNKNGIIKFRCSKKLLLGSIKDLGDCIGEPKLEIDYDKYYHFDSLNDVPKKLKEYIRQDTRIMEIYLNRYLDLFGDFKLTIASQSINHFKDFYGKENYIKDFVNKYDKDYWNYFNQFNYGGSVLYKNKNLDRTFKTKLGYYYDITNSYGYCLLKMLLPYSYPLIKQPKGLYVCLYEVHIIKASLKDEKMMPIIVNLFDNGMYENRFSENIKNQIHFYNNIDFELIKKFYNIKYKIIKTTYFKAKYGIFSDWIKYWYDKRKNAKNKIDKDFYKLIPNSLTGKWNQSIVRFNKIITGEYKDDGTFKEEVRESDSYYITYNVMYGFLTAGGRQTLYNALLKSKNYRYSVYCDTDSIVALRKLDLPISDKLGEFKIEFTFNQFYFNRGKSYNFEVVEHFKDDKIKSILKASGLNNKELNLVNFKRGDIIYQKRKKRVRGGVILKEMIHTL